MKKTYSPFWALLLFFAAVIVMDLHQTVTLHRQKLAIMQQYNQTLQVGKKVAEQTKWIGAMQKDLLRMAPGDPEALQIVSDLKLQTQR